MACICARVHVKNDFGPWGDVNRLIKNIVLLRLILHGFLSQRKATKKMRFCHLDYIKHGEEIFRLIYNFFIVFYLKAK